MSLAHPLSIHHQTFHKAKHLIIIIIPAPFQSISGIPTSIFFGNQGRVWLGKMQGVSQQVTSPPSAGQDKK